MAVTDTTKPTTGDEGGMGYLQSLPRRVVTIYLPLLVFVIVLLFPFYWMAITSVKPNEQMTNFNDYSPFWVVGPTLEHFRYLLFETSYPGWLWNTILISTASTVLSLFAAVFAAYAIERLRFSGSRQVGLAIFLAYLVPPSILFIPLAVMVFKLGLYDTPFALILTYPTFLVPFCTWLLMGYFRSIPFELEECALIDGASRWQILHQDHPAALGAGIDLGRHLRLHAVLERVHLRADLHPVVGKQDRAGRRPDRTRPLRRLRVGRADGRRADRLAAGRHPLFLLRRALRLVDDRRGEGVDCGS